MITVTSVEAQSRFGELIDRSQREPVEVTRRGRTVAYVVSGHDMQEQIYIWSRFVGDFLVPTSKHQHQWII